MEKREFPHRIGRKKMKAVFVTAGTHERLRRAKYRFEKESFNEAITALLDEHEAKEKEE